jgi:hypothetical protein
MPAMRDALEAMNGKDERPACPHLSIDELI